MALLVTLEAPSTTGGGLLMSTAVDRPNAVGYHPIAHASSQMLAPLRRSASPRRLLLRRVLPLLLVLPPVACDRGPSPADRAVSPRRGGTIVIGQSSDMEGVNELVSGRTQFTQDVIERMFGGLLEELPEAAEGPPGFAPDLAASWEWSQDHTELTLRLRPDLVWSDGTPLTAEDVRWSWQAQIAPEIAWAYAQSKEAITGVEVVDHRTVVFRFSRVYPSQLLDVNEGRVLPRHAWSALPWSEWRQNADWFRRHLVVNGPFVLESWIPQQEIVLVRNQRYHEALLPSLDRVVFRIIPEKSTQILELLAGTIDLVQFVPPEQAAALRQAPGIRLVSSWAPQYSFIAWNLGSPLFAEPEVRQALTLAIDRRAIVDTLWHGYARLAVSPIVSSFWAHDNSLEPWDYAPQQAASILARQGWSDSDGDGILDRAGQRFAFELITNGDNQIRADAAVMIQEQLRRIGVAARPRLLDLNAVNAKALSHDFDALLSAWNIDTSLDLSYAFHSDSIDGGYNFGSYANAEVDRLLRAYRQEVEPEEIRRILHRLQRIIHQDQPYTFLWEPQRVLAVRERLQGVSGNPLSAFADLRSWWVTQDG